MIAFTIENRPPDRESLNSLSQPLAGSLVIKVAGVPKFSMSVTYGIARISCIIQYALRLYSAILAPQHPQKTKPSFISAPHTGHFLAGFSPASFAGSGSRREPHCVQNRRPS